MGRPARLVGEATKEGWSDPCPGWSLDGSCGPQLIGEEMGVPHRERGAAERDGRQSLHRRGEHAGDLGSGRESPADSTVTGRQPSRPIRIAAYPIPSETAP